ncbi:DUF6339 family protein [Flavihumibacter fluvii]|uniref:DUF6339 family protein n=1 Tax=Flavihumibacter fluvii TaxID=2838157 RepID=UPI001BDF32FB|nr:DUF6339 family protein [Flavihumibacter fluvii]ULQ50971.1 DUF6339 family protein [Flavihumibacter fluvii]
MKIFTESCCEVLLNIAIDDDKKKEYLNETFDSSKFEFLGIENNINIPSDFELELSVHPRDPDNSKKDLNNSILIFELLKDIDRVQANDKRLWVTLSHHIFFKYSKSRWLKSEEFTSEMIRRRFHFEGASLETRMRNSISRLWWSAKLTYDKNREDPYELTKLLFSKQDIFQNLVERSYGTYDSVVKGFLEFYSEKNYLKEDQLRRLFTALNSIGGVKVLPVHNKEEIKQILGDLIEYYGYKISA